MSRLSTNQPKFLTAAHPQALRIYFTSPAMVLGEFDNNSAFDTTFELMQLELLPPQKDMRFIPLCGGNYVLWGISDRFQCVTIFGEETPREPAKAIVEIMLAILEEGLHDPGKIPGFFPKGDSF
ncbi:MAG: hypothetical protein ACXAEL_14120 [Candidatus Hodarchaeales archaeon]